MTRQTRQTVGTFSVQSKNTVAIKPVRKARMTTAAEVVQTVWGAEVRDESIESAILAVCHD